MVKLFYYTQIELQCFNVIAFQWENSGIRGREPSFSHSVRFIGRDLWQHSRDCGTMIDPLNWIIWFACGWMSKDRCDDSEKCVLMSIDSYMTRTIKYSSDIRIYVLECCGLIVTDFLSFEI